jgi:hypothetical protein
VKIDDAFDRFDKAIAPSAAQQRIARGRVDRFTAILKTIDPRIEVVPSGSWARGTSLGPIRDVDLIAVFPPDMFPDWDGGPGTATAALTRVAGLIEDRLSEHYGLPYVWHAEPRNHVVKCYLDSRIATDIRTWRGFAVEVMPALRDGDALRVPERHADRWRTVDPEHLARKTAARQAEWPHYQAMVRLLKHWAREHPQLHLSSLAIEVLALRCLPHPPLIGTLTRTEALARFFTAAEY